MLGILKQPIAMEMSQKEVTDKENTKWTCVQAYAGMQQKLAEKAAEISQNNDGKVTVVCTPNGGAKTVRLELEEDWFEKITDDELLAKIEKAVD